MEPLLKIALIGLLIVIILLSQVAILTCRIHKILKIAQSDKEDDQQ